MIEAHGPSEDDLQTLATEWMFYASHFGLIAEILNGRWTSEQVTDMPRGVLMLISELRDLRARCDVDARKPPSADRPTTEYLTLWQEQAERERKRNSADRAQIDLGTWIAILIELRELRALFTAQTTAKKDA